MSESVISLSVAGSSSADIGVAQICEALTAPPAWRKAGGATELVATISEEIACHEK